MALQHLRSGTANKRPIPTVMSAGQLAINTNEGSPGLFFKDSNGDLVKVGPVHIGTSAPNSSPDSVAATALVTGTVYQILTVGNSDFTLVGASANTVGTIFTATGTTTGTGTVSGQQGNEKGEQWLDTTGSAFDLKIYDGTAWRSQAGEFVNVTGDTMTGNLVMNNANVVFEGATADDFETTLTVTDPTADRTITLPNVTGTVVTTGDTGSVTSAMITDGTIVNADINASAEIAVSKLANGTARQLLQTDSGGSGVEFTSNVDVPGTLDVTNAGTFDSTVAVTGLLSANGKLAYPAGTAAAVGLYAGSDTDTGIYSPGSNQFGIATAGTSRIVVDASGNVGVGTASPSEKFVVSNGGNEGFEVVPASASNLNVFYNYNRNTNAYIDSRNLALSHQFWTGSSSSEAMRIDSSGRLLVGASSGQGNAHLQIEGDASSAAAQGSISLRRGLNTAAIGGNVGADLGAITFGANDGTVAAKIASQSDAAWSSTSDCPGRLVFSTTADGASSPTERLRIDSSGNVLVAKTASTGLSVGCELRSTGQGIFTRNSGNPLQVRRLNTDGDLIEFYNDAALVGSLGASGNDFTFSVAGSEKMRIDSSGRLLVGVSSTSQNNTAVFQGTGQGSSAAGVFLTSTVNNPSSTQVLAKLAFADSGHVDAASIKCARDGGTWTSGSSQPSALSFFTTANGSASPTEQMIINSGGGFTFPNSSGTVLQAVTPGVSYRNLNIGALEFIVGTGAGSATERMRFTTNGLMKVSSSGTYSTSVSTGLNHEIRNDNSGWDTIYFSSQNANPYGIQINLGTVKNNSTNYFLYCGDNTKRLQINSNGGIQNYQGNDYNLCDEREKKNIVDLGSKWDKVKSWELKKFHYNEDANTDNLRYGVIAQQVETVCPEVLADWQKQKATDAVLDEDGNVVEPAKEEVLRKGVKEQQMMWMAIKALQEAMAKIETLEAKVAALEAG